LPESKDFHLDSYKMVWDEFRRRHGAKAEHTKWIDQFKALLKQLAGDAQELKLGGQKVATLSPGQLNRQLLAKEQPDIVKQYTRMVAREQFDEAWFKREQPDMYKQYQAQRLVLSEGATPIEGLG